MYATINYDTGFTDDFLLRLIAYLVMLEIGYAPSAYIVRTVHWTRIVTQTNL